jgi:hypothetical protein
MNITEQEQAAVTRLQAIVAQFNAAFHSWRGEFGMQADFGWSYDTSGRGDVAPKYMEIAAIDRTIYRRPPPNEDEFRARLQALSGTEEGD